MRGKQKCRFLKEIRQRIADENDIPFATEECTYKGACKGTCPKCESELRYLEEQLRKRRALGMKVTVSAVAIGLLTGLPGCEARTGEKAKNENDSSSETLQAETEVQTAEQLEGEIAIQEPSSADDVFELEGDVAFIPEATESVPEETP